MLDKALLKKIRLERGDNMGINEIIKIGSRIKMLRKATGLSQKKWRSFVTYLLQPIQITRTIIVSLI